MDISLQGLLVYYTVLLLPLGILFYFRVRLVRTLAVSLLRMSVQLALMAFYLEYIFAFNHPLVNAGFVVIMIIAAALMVINRSDLTRWFTLPLISSLTLSLVVPVTVLFLVGSQIKLLHAPVFIPLAGMLLGNSMSACIIALRRIQNDLSEQGEFWQFLLVLGHPAGQALRFFLRPAFNDALAPMLATVATVGLVSMPGMMTGQILGGAGVELAARYQVAIYIGIISTTVTSIWLGVFMARPLFFDRHGNLKQAAE